LNLRGDKHAEPPIYTLGSSSALVGRNAQIRPFCTAQPQQVHHREASAYSADLKLFESKTRCPFIAVRDREER
jgi:hypothetical protein